MSYNNQYQTETESSILFFKIDMSQTQTCVHCSFEWPVRGSPAYDALMAISKPTEVEKAKCASANFNHGAYPGKEACFTCAFHVPFLKSVVFPIVSPVNSIHE